jgi:hypothetical protein
MGGRAIIPIIGKEADRITKAEKEDYLLLFKSLDFYPVREIEEKEDYGDIDFLIQSNQSKKEVLDKVTNTLSQKNYSLSGSIMNSEVISLAINNKHQIDLIFTDNVLLASHYYSDNDRGNLIGNIFHHLGFNYGHKGLYINLDSTKLLLSKNTEHILSFLEYDPLDILKIIDYNNSFKTFEEMFEWVIKCPLFNSEYYKFENLNNENRTRNKKRSTYNRFLKYLENKKFNNPVIPTNAIKYYALEYFNKEKEYIQILKDIEFNKSRRTIINGEIISEITKLKEKELGQFIIYVKSSPFYKKIGDNNISLYINGYKDYVVQEIKLLYESFISKEHR